MAETETEKIRILHLITHVFMCKVHAIFDDNDEYTNYYIYPKYTADKSIGFLETGPGVLQGDRTKNHLVGLEVVSVSTFFDQVQPHVIFLTNPNLNQGLIDLVGKWKREKGTLLYFLNHGIMNQDILHQTIANGNIVKHSIWSGFDQVFITKTEQELWCRNNQYVSGNRINLVPGLAQIDWMRTIDLDHYQKLVYSHVSKKGYLTGNGDGNGGLSLEKKSILFINCKNYTYTPQQQIKETGQILKFLQDYCGENGHHLFIKMKHSSAVKHMIGGRKVEHVNWFDNPNVTPINYNEGNLDVPLYYLLFCDVIIVQNYGTTLVESFLLKPEVIRCQTLKKDNQAQMNEFPHLMQAFDVKTLRGQLDDIFSGVYPGEEGSEKREKVEADRKEFLKMHLGDNYGGSTSEIVLRKLKEDLKKIE